MVEDKCNSKSSRVFFFCVLPSSCTVEGLRTHREAEQRWPGPGEELGWEHCVAFPSQSSKRQGPLGSSLLSVPGSWALQRSCLWVSGVLQNVPVSPKQGTTSARVSQISAHQPPHLEQITGPLQPQLLYLQKEDSNSLFGCVENWNNFRILFWFVAESKSKRIYFLNLSPMTSRRQNCRVLLGLLAPESLGYGK
jgi:hypothetical protein